MNISTGSSFRLSIFLLILCSAPLLPADDAVRLALSFDGGLAVPLGPTDPAGDILYGMGGGGRIALSLVPSALPWLYAETELGEDIARSILVNQTISLTRLGLGAGLRYDSRFFEARLQGQGGFFYGFYNGLSGGNIYWDARASAYFKLSAALGLGVSGGWRDYLNIGGSPSSTLGGGYASLAIILYPGAFKARSQLRIKNLFIEPLYPILTKYYDSNPIGYIEFVNTELYDISDVKVSLMINGYMDRPKLCAELPILRKGQSARVDLYALLTPVVLGITEGVVSAVDIEIEYKMIDRVERVKFPHTVNILDRNAMSWDDTRKAAAFVTAKDPEVLGFAKALGSEAQASAVLAGDLSLRAALGIFEGLSLAGLRYVTDPRSSYAVLSENTKAVDYLQFPAQTLAYRSGDCDDLSILYCALLESIGVETAFITVPGHIMPAFALEMDERSARSLLANPEDAIYLNGKAWLPVEITMVGTSFIQAWKKGARNWREAQVLDQAELTLVHEAWKVYQPVGLVDAAKAPTPPDSRALIAAWKTEFERLWQSEGVERERALLAEIARAQTAQRPALQNRLAILYARFGKNDRAEPLFAAAANAGMASARINLAHLNLAAGRHREALGHYDTALLSLPDSRAALNGVVQCAEVLGLSSRVLAARARLATLDALSDEDARVPANESAGERQSFAGSAARFSWMEE